MDIDIRKTASLLLSAVLLLQAAGCSGRDDPEETVTEVTNASAEPDLFSEDDVTDCADRFAMALKTCDTDELELLCDSSYSDFSTDVEDMVSFYSINPGTDDTAKVYQAIVDNLRYETDPDSVCIDEDSETAAVDISFQLPDYEVLFEDPYIHNADDFVQEASVTFADPFVITIEMEFDDDSWRVTNYREVIGIVYDFVNMEFDPDRPVTTTDPNGVPDIELTSDHLDWWSDYGDDPCDPVFVNAERIAAELPLEEDGADMTGISAVFSSEGTVFATETDSAFVEFDVWDVPDDHRIWVEGTLDYYLAPGEYNITFYNTDGSVILSQDIKIEYQPDELGYRVDFTGLYSEDDVRYVNTTEITACLMEGEACIIPVSGSATVSYNDEIVMEVDSINSNAVIFSVRSAGAPADPSGNYLAAGEYTVTFYDYTGELLATGTCTVEVV